VLGRRHVLVRQHPLRQKQHGNVQGAVWRGLPKLFVSVANSRENLVRLPQ
jgi:hypothetical protein